MYTLVEYQIVEESGAVPKKKPPGLSTASTFFKRRLTISSLVKESCKDQIDCKVKDKDTKGALSSNDQQYLMTETLQIDLLANERDTTLCPQEGPGLVNVLPDPPKSSEI